MTEWLQSLNRYLSIYAILCGKRLVFIIFLAFCTLDDMLLPLWVRIQDQARESYAMREVFEIDSSVRVHAIENLGTKFYVTIFEGSSSPHTWILVYRDSELIFGL